MKHRAALTLFLWSACAGFAADGIYGVFSEAGIGNAVAAPGSVILIRSYSLPLGPAVRREAAGFPLVTTLAGTSVKITIGATALDAYILAAESQWVRALLPSGTPLGDGSLVVTYNGQASDAYRITVVKRQFGLYNGADAPPFGQRAVQNVSAAAEVAGNTFVAPARPGEFAVLWGTGLGAAPGNEAAGTVPGDLHIPGLQVTVGNQQANLLYAGRSGCCAGMDQIVFQVPPGVEGCNVPVWIRFAGDGSGTADAMVAIASGSGACSDPGGLSESEVRAAAAGNLRAAQFSVDNAWHAAFGSATPAFSPPAGACMANPWSVGTLPFAIASPRNAGAQLNIAGPGQELQAKRTDDNTYVAALASQAAPGNYTLDNGAGSADVGALRVSVTVPQLAFTWSAPDAVTSTGLADGLPLAWSAADGYVWVWGQFSDGETCGACGFACLERADKGSLVLPGAILQRAANARGNPDSLDLRMTLWRSERLTVPGFDVASFTVYGGGSNKSVAIR